jgi:outer membrane protein
MEVTISARKILTPVALTLALAASAVAGAAELKIGYVDLQRALQEVNDARSAKARLQSMVDDRKKVFEREQSDLMKEKDTFEKQASAMSPAARSQRQTDLGKKAFDLGQRWEKEKADFAQKERDEMQTIFAKMNPIIAGIAQREGMTFVFEKNEAGILYAPTYLDITNELVRLYNDQTSTKGDIKPTRAVEPKAAGSAKKK